jgi:hypothetical protein
MSSRCPPASVPARARAWLAPALLLAACGSDIGVTEKARCDGALQAGEDTVDGPFDADGDGFYDGANPDCASTWPAEALDCDDNDPAVHPGAEEVGCNGADDDCDPATADVADVDGDGFDSCSDCDDQDSLTRPGGREEPCNGYDDDCDPATVDEADADADGFSSCEECDDTTPRVNPDADEVDCNGIDDDCDPATPDGVDADGDGYSACDADCDDADPARNPGRSELCDNTVDDNCNGEVDEGCEVDYTGTWALDPALRYSCASGLVNINLSSVAVVSAHPLIDIRAGSSQPGQMSGVFTSDVDFDVGRNIAGTCTEDYRMVGTFTSDTTFSATLDIVFTDTYGLGLCLDCVNQRFTVTGSR